MRHSRILSPSKATKPPILLPHHLLLAQMFVLQRSDENELERNFSRHALRVVSNTAWPHRKSMSQDGSHSCCYTFLFILLKQISFYIKSISAYLYDYSRIRGDLLECQAFLNKLFYLEVRNRLGMNEVIFSYESLWPRLNQWWNEIHSILANCVVSRRKLIRITRLSGSILCKSKTTNL